MKLCTIYGTTGKGICALHLFSLFEQSERLHLTAF